MYTSIHGLYTVWIKSSVILYRARCGKTSSETRVLLLTCFHVLERVLAWRYGISVGGRVTGRDRRETVPHSVSCYLSGLKVSVFAAKLSLKVVNNGTKQAIGPQPPLPLLTSTTHGFLTSRGSCWKCVPRALECPLRSLVRAVQSAKPRRLHLLLCNVCQERSSSILLPLL